MMYRHTITLYDKSGTLLAKIKDEVSLKKYGFAEYEGDKYLGAPVEAVFSNEGKTLWVSNYEMKGEGFNNPGCDACHGKEYDPGFVYKINTQTFEIENVIKVGSVPKFMAISSDEKRLLVSNWSSGDVSIIDTETEKEIKRVYVGSHPRGIDITKDRKRAYVTVMGSTKIAVIDLRTYDVQYIKSIGNSPRHVVLSENDSLLYVAVNSSNCVVKYCLENGKKEVCKTNSGPRTMVLSPDQNFLYVVNYFANTFTKIRTDSMTVMEVVETENHPIGITANWEDAEIWVACYTGIIEVFKDFHLEKMNEKGFLDWGIAEFLPSFSIDDSVDRPKEKIISKEELESDPTEKDLPARGQVETANNDEIIDRTYKEAEVEVNDTASNEETVIADTTEPDTAPEKTEEPVRPKVNSTSITKVDKTEIPVKTNENEAGCSYHIIVGSFSVYDNAVNFRKKMEDQGYPAQLLDSNKGLTYVSVQCFTSRDQANSNIPSVTDKTGVKGWVLKR